jgi:predicted RNA binding protein with dsRBD fold (UPF0201 family)
MSEWYPTENLEKSDDAINELYKRMFIKMQDDKDFYDRQVKMFQNTIKTCIAVIEDLSGSERKKFVKYAKIYITELQLTLGETFGDGGEFNF